MYKVNKKPSSGQIKRKKNKKDTLVLFIQPQDLLLDGDGHQTINSVTDGFFSADESIKKG